jgi:hypothetical protein
MSVASRTDFFLAPGVVDLESYNLIRTFMGRPQQNMTSNRDQTASKEQFRLSKRSSR